VRVVELADEGNMTTAEALDICDRAGIPAEHGGSELTDEQVVMFRRAVEQPAPTAVPAASGLPFGGAVPLPPDPQPMWSAPTEPAKVAKPSYKPAKKPFDRGAIWALVFALLPLPNLFIHWGPDRIEIHRYYEWLLAALYILGAHGGWIFAVPTFYLARGVRENAHRRHGELRGGTLAYFAVILAVMVASVCTGVTLLRWGAAGDRGREAMENVMTGNADLNKQSTTSTLDPTKPDPGADGGARGGTPDHLLTGDCVTPVASRGPNAVIDGEFTIVDCAPPHDAEVVVSFDVTELETASGVALPGEGPRPTVEQFKTAMSTACIGPVRQLAAGRPEVGALAMVFVVPTETAWANGARVVACAVGSRDGSRIVGSVTG
jgi:hypothetical protein